MREADREGRDAAWRACPGPGVPLPRNGRAVLSEAGRRGRVVLAPTAEAFAREAVEAGGGTVVGPGEGADCLVWLGRPAEVAAALEAEDALEWVQLPMAGVEGVAEAGVFDDPRWSGLTWTCAKGSFAEPVAEHALALALAGLRHLALRARATSWGEQAGTTLYDAQVTVLGGGGIAASLLQLLEPFRVRATVVRRSAEPLAGAWRTVTPEHLHEVLPGSRCLFVALALHPGTVKVVGERELELLGPDGWLVNVARGRHVDTEALVKALQEGTIGGAGLDVTDPEPLPAGHPLWSMPNCLVTPHTADTPEMVRALLATRVTENVARWREGRRLVGLVDPAAGY